MSINWFLVSKIIAVIVALTLCIIAPNLAAIILSTSAFVYYKSDWIIIKLTKFAGRLMKYVIGANLGTEESRGLVGNIIVSLMEGVGKIVNKTPVFLGGSHTVMYFEGCRFLLSKSGAQLPGNVRVILKRGEDEIDITTNPLTDYPNAATLGGSKIIIVRGKNAIATFGPSEAVPKGEVLSLFR